MVISLSKLTGWSRADIMALTFEEAEEWHEDAVEFHNYLNR